MTQAEEIVPARTLGGEKTESLGGTGKSLEQLWLRELWREMRLPKSRGPADVMS